MDGNEVFSSLIGRGTKLMDTDRELRKLVRQDVKIEDITTAFELGACILSLNRAAALKHIPIWFIARGQKGNTIGYAEQPLCYIIYVEDLFFNLFHPENAMTDGSKASYEGTIISHAAFLIRLRLQDLGIVRMFSEVSKTFIDDEGIRSILKTVEIIYKRVSLEFSNRDFLPELFDASAIQGIVLNEIEIGSNIQKIINIIRMQAPR